MTTIVEYAFPAFDTNNKNVAEKVKTGSMKKCKVYNE